MNKPQAQAHFEAGIAPAALGRVGVLYGGHSAERDISLVTGQAIITALQQRGVDVYGMDIQPGITSVQDLIAQRFDRVFLALHGPMGEDGTIQGLLEMLQIPYTGSRVAGSAIAMDKILSKQIWQAAGLPVIPFQAVHRASPDQWKVEHYPVCVKPAREGSSVGISRVQSAAEMPAALALAHQYGEWALVEPWITGTEYTVGIVGQTCLPSIRITPQEGFYDYTAKYTVGKTAYTCPSGLAPDQEQAIRNLAWQAFVALRCIGWGRVDFMADPQGQLWIIEVNTIPGMTPTSLLPRAAQVWGWDFSELVYRIVCEAM